MDEEEVTFYLWCIFVIHISISFFWPVWLILICSHFFASHSLTHSFSVSLAHSFFLWVEGTSEGSGWLSLLEADGRPKARGPQFHEAWFEHARTMSRGMPMDDGYMVCVCVWMIGGGWWVGWMVDFVGYQSEETGPLITVCPSLICASLVWVTIASITFQWFCGFEAPFYSWCPAAL